MTISERIKYLRTEGRDGKMSREAFGRAMGVSGGAIQNLEEAENRLKGGVPDSMIRLICATYHVNYQWLTEGREPMYLVPEGEELIVKYAPHAMEHMANAIRIMSSLSDEDWKALRAYIDDLVKIVDGMRAEEP